jgi:hypothetical protein
MFRFLWCVANFRGPDAYQYLPVGKQNIVQRTFKFMTTHSRRHHLRNYHHHRPHRCHR